MTDNGLFRTWSSAKSSLSFWTCPPNSCGPFSPPAEEGFGVVPTAPVDLAPEAAGFSGFRSLSSPNLPQSGSRAGAAPFLPLILQESTVQE